jgi:hypothetical protein
VWFASTTHSVTITWRRWISWRMPPGRCEPRPGPRCAAPTPPATGASANTLPTSSSIPEAPSQLSSRQSRSVSWCCTARTWSFAVGIGTPPWVVGISMAPTGAKTRWVFWVRMGGFPSRVSCPVRRIRSARGGHFEAGRARGSRGGPPAGCEAGHPKGVARRGTAKSRRAQVTRRLHRRAEQCRG